MIKLFKKNKIVSTILVAVQITVLLAGLSGCGKASADIPELIEPSTIATAYRPVSKRTVGKIEMIYGHVVPKEYPVYSDKTVSLSEILVSVGDYVEAGQVIARVNTAALDERAASINAQIASLNRMRSNKKNISDKSIEKMGYELKIEEYLQNEEGIKTKTKEIAVERENQRYNLAVYDADISSLKSELAEITEQQSNNEFVAPISGPVVYVRDLTESNEIPGNQNIVTIADYDDLYIEAEDKNINKYEFENYKSKWTYLNGKKVEIDERNYSNEEVSYALSVQMNPPMAFDVKEGQLIMGTDMPMYFLEGDDAPQLAVGNDSIYRDSGENFVYVKGPDGKNEKRIIELGVTDGLYTEVISGLEEGELVFYNNRAMIPSSRDIYEVELSDYVEECTSKIVDLAYPKYEIYTSEISGDFSRIANTGMASAGDALFSVDSNAGKGDVEEARLTIENLDKTRQEALDTYNKNRAELEEILKGAEMFTAEDMGTSTDAIYENMYLAERTKCDIDTLDIQESYEKAEYNATRSIKMEEYEKIRIGTTYVDGHSDYVESAVRDGKIAAIVHDNDAKIEKGSYVLTESYRNDKPNHTKLLAIISEEPGLVSPINTAYLGQKVTLVNKQEDDGSAEDVKNLKTWTGTCIGINGSKDRFMLFTDDDRPHVTFSAPFNKNVEYQCILEMDGEITETDLLRNELTIPAREMRQVVAVPMKAVKSEVDQLTQKEKHFVWKLEGEEYVKEYVIVYDSISATGTKYILSGLEVGDKILK